MKKTFMIILVSLTLLLIIDTNTFAFTWGSGVLAIEKRTVTQFQSIELCGVGNVYLQQGNEQSLKVKTDDNLLQKLDTNVSNGKLKIGFKPEVSHVTLLEVFIILKDLKELTVSGSGKIQGKGVFETPDLKLVICGSGAIDLEMKARNIFTVISGSGDITLKGQVDNQEININGSGNYNGFDLHVEKAAVTIRGSGNCEVNVAQELNIELYGSGNVIYLGRPALNSKIFGSGKISSQN